jgi:ketosteroid isomerase-like protein
MHPNETLIANFYNAFQRTEAAVMAACYHADVVFHDNAFGALQGEQVRAMWHMLCRSAKDLQLTFSNVQADDRGGRTHWEARYTFSRTGRKVHNRIEAQFGFRDGLIIRLYRK